MTTQPIPDTTWCPDCRRTQVVDERIENGRQTRDGETAYTTTHLACGHTLQGPERVVETAPGAPFAPEAVPTLKDARTWGALAGALGGVPADPWAEDQ